MHMTALEGLAGGSGHGDALQVAATLFEHAEGMDHPLMHLLEIDVQPAEQRKAPGRPGAPRTAEKGREQVLLIPDSLPTTQLLDEAGCMDVPLPYSYL